MNEAQALASKIAAKAPLAIRQAKVALNAGIEMDLDNGLRFETEAVAHLRERLGCGIDGKIGCAIISISAETPQSARGTYPSAR